MDERIRKLTQDEDWKRELRYVLFARRRSILSTAGVVLAGAILIVLFWPRQYESTASLLIRAKRAEVSPAMLDPVEFRHPEISDRDVISEMEILQSPELARRVVGQLKAHGAWETAPVRRPELTAWVRAGVVRADRRVFGDANVLRRLVRERTKPPPQGDMAEARVFLRHLDVTRVPASSVIRLRFSADSLQAAEVGLEALLDQYMPFRSEVFHPVGQEAFFADRMAHYRDELRTLVNRVDDAGGGVNPTFIDMQIKGNLERLVSLQQQLGELEMELATSAYLDNQPLLRRIEMAKASIVDLESENRAIQRQRLIAEAAQQEAQLISHSLNTFAQRAEEARINDSIAQNNLAGDIRILSRASGTGELVFPRKRQILLLGLIAALATGVCVGFVTDFFDHTVRRPEDITRTTGLAVICSVPKV